jgi:hypothetical protein
MEEDAPSALSKEKRTALSPGERPCPECTRMPVRGLAAGLKLLLARMLPALPRPGGMGMLPLLLSCGPCCGPACSRVSALL